MNDNHMERCLIVVVIGFPVVLAGKNLPARAGDISKTHGFDPWVGKISPGGGHGNLLQYS